MLKNVAKKFVDEIAMMRYPIEVCFSTNWPKPNEADELILTGRVSPSIFWKDNKSLMTQQNVDITSLLQRVAALEAENAQLRSALDEQNKSPNK